MIKNDTILDTKLAEIASQLKKCSEAYEELRKKATGPSNELQDYSIK